MIGQLSSIPFRSCVIIGSCAQYIPTRTSVSALNSRAVAQGEAHNKPMGTQSVRCPGVPIVIVSHPYRIHLGRIPESFAGVHACDIPRRFVRACFVAGSRTLQGDPDHRSMVHVILSDSKKYISPFRGSPP